jgi:hypothetical protein
MQERVSLSDNLAFYCGQDDLNAEPVAAGEKRTMATGKLRPTSDVHGPD